MFFYEFVLVWKRRMSSLQVFDGSEGPGWKSRFPFASHEAEKSHSSSLRVSRRGVLVPHASDEPDIRSLRVLRMPLTTTREQILEFSLLLGVAGTTRRKVGKTLFLRWARAVSGSGEGSNPQIALSQGVLTALTLTEAIDQRRRPWSALLVFRCMDCCCPLPCKNIPLAS